jgi:hypothetical protein
LAERREHVVIREVRVASARVRQHEQPRAVNGRVLKPGLDHRRLGVANDAPQRAIHRHADERDDRGAEAFDLLLQDLPSLEVLVRFQGIDPRRWPRNQVGHSDTPPGQPDVVFVRDGLGNDA